MVCVRRRREERGDLREEERGKKRTFRRVSYTKRFFSLEF